MPTKAEDDLDSWRYASIECSKQVVAKVLRDPDSAQFRDVTMVALSISTARCRALFVGTEFFNTIRQKETVAEVLDRHALSVSCDRDEVLLMLTDREQRRIAESLRALVDEVE